MGGQPGLAAALRTLKLALLVITIFMIVSSTAAVGWYW